MGQGLARIRTDQPLFVKIQAPSFLVLGDTVEIRVDVHNQTGRALWASVRLNGRGRRIRVPADRPGVARWKLRATDSAGLVLTADVRAGSLVDAMRRVVPVRKPGREVLIGQRMPFTSETPLEFVAPKGVHGMTLGLHGKHGELTRILEALRYLNSYPYG